MSDERRKNKLEKRGRFIIQEVTEKNNTKSPERIRHESICLNKKFYFTNKHFDNNEEFPEFTSFVFDHRRREWIAFSKIWKQYRKSSNNSFKEIFHYIEHDNSSDSFTSYSKIKTNDESFTYKNKKNKSYKELVHKLKLNGFLFNPIKKVLKQFDTIKNLSYEQTDVITYNKEKERKKKYENLKIEIQLSTYIK